MNTEILNKHLTENEIETLKLIVRKNLWGDCDMGFVSMGWIADGEIGKTQYTTFSCIGATTDDLGDKSISGTISSIVRKIKTIGEVGHILQYEKDWHDDGGSDYIFFNEEGLETNWSDLQEWAESLSDKTVESYYTDLSDAIDRRSIKDTKRLIELIIGDGAIISSSHRTQLKTAINELCKLERTYVREKLIIQLSDQNYSEK